MSLICSLSGTVPEHPVISTISGHVYEKRLIEKYLISHSTCPITNNPMILKDIINVQTMNISNNIKPRHPSATSIPSILNLLQDEYDSLVLESYELKQTISRLRQDLAHSLYQNDAATRVIARVINERDKALQTLTNSKHIVQSSVRATENKNNSMETDEINENKQINQINGDNNENQPEDQTIEKFHQILADTSKQLSSTRKQRVKLSQSKVPNSDTIRSFTSIKTHPFNSDYPITSMNLHEQHQIIATGDNNGKITLFNLSTSKTVETINNNKQPIRDIILHPTKSILLSASQDNTTSIYTYNDEYKVSLNTHLTDHTDIVNSLTLHPSGEYFASSSFDESWILYDLSTSAKLFTVKDNNIHSKYNEIQFHSDGLILGSANSDSTIRIFDIKQKLNVATLNGHQTNVNTLSFSENGYYLISGDNNGIIKLWDLRKVSEIRSFTINKDVFIQKLKFDDSGLYLSAATNNLLYIYETKNWNELVALNDHKSAINQINWNINSNSILTCSNDSTVKVWSNSHNASQE